MRWDLWYFKWPYITTRKMATRLRSADRSNYLQQWQMTTIIVTFCLRYSNVLLPSILFCQCYSCWKLISDSNDTTNSREVKQGMIKSLSLNGVKIAKKKRNAKLWRTIKIINCIRKNAIKCYCQMTKLTHNSFQYIYSNSLHVSSNLVLIIGRINCISTTSGICNSVLVWVTVSCEGRRPVHETVTNTE